jgi:uncharacterized Rossmann fold enzyme
MDYQTWLPVYERILADFGFEKAGDERARDRLADLTDPFDEGCLDAVAGATVAVVGAAPSLDPGDAAIADADLVFAASGAADTLRSVGVGVDLMTTDLDKTPSTARALTEAGVPVAVHAHGDNLDLVERWVPELVGDHVLPTTQAEPHGPVVNFGGFTDGDRAAFLADAAGADTLLFAGWAFDDPSVGPRKRRKLAWAERLLYWLERRRGERFSVLDGRREGVEAVEA